MITTLPSSITSFVGREDDIAPLIQMVTTHRLVTLVGAGGIGKTRLALHVAAAVEGEFMDGIHMLGLASVSDSTQILPFIASTLAIREQAGRPLLQTLIDAFRSRHALFIFDNCEHVMAACTTLAHSLLQYCPGLHLLATSRERLRLTGEVLWRTGSLSFPSISAPPSLAAFLRYDAIQLFCERARAAMPSFYPTADTIVCIAHVCRCLDGLPLAIELAAARLSTLSIDQLTARLDERFHLLIDTNRADTRHQTLQATFDWSYALLSAAEQIVLQRLSIFGTSWTLEAAENICTDEETRGEEIFAILTHLLHTSWIVPQEYEEGQVFRYRLLETIQQYAHHRLQTNTNASQLSMRHWEWYLHFIEAATSHLHGAEQTRWLDRVEYEADNLRLALKRSLAAKQTEIAARIAIALGPFWIRRAQLSEGRSWYDRLLAITDLPASLRLHLLHYAAEILRFQGDYTQMRSLLRERIALLKLSDDTAELAATCCSLGWAAFYQGDDEEATTYCMEGLRLFRSIEDKPGVARCLSGLALVAMLQSAYQRATDLLEEVIFIRRELQDSAELAFALNALTRVAVLQGQKQTAYRACQESLRLISQLKQPFGIIYSIEATAMLAVGYSNLMEAVQLFGAAHALRTTIGIPIPPSLRTLREHELLPLHTQLDTDTFAEQWARGQSLSLDQAFAKALEVFEQIQTVFVATLERSAGLSPREIEVLRLVGAGLTDAQVAQDLVLSTRTVSTHLHSIYRKVGVSSRSAAIRFAADHHLL